MDRDIPFAVLVVDDEIANIEALRIAMIDEWEVVGLTDPHELKKDFTKWVNVDLVLLDLMFDRQTSVDAMATQELNGFLGLEFLDFLQSKYRTLPVMIYSGNLHDHVATHIREKYPHIGFLPKPVDFDEAFKHKMEYYRDNFVRYLYEDSKKSLEDS